MGWLQKIKKRFLPGAWKEEAERKREERRKKRAVLLGPAKVSAMKSLERRIAERKERVDEDARRREEKKKREELVARYERERIRKNLEKVARRRDSEFYL